MMKILETWRLTRYFLWMTLNQYYSNTVNLEIVDTKLERTSSSPVACVLSCLLFLISQDFFLSFLLSNYSTTGQSR